MPPQRELRSTRTRISIAVATLPWLVVLPFVLAATGNRTGYVYLTASTISSPATKVATYSSEVLQTLLIVTFIAAAIGWSTLFRGVRRSSHFRPRRVALLACVPLASFLVVLGLFIARLTQLPNSWGTRGGVYPVALDGNPSAAHVLHVVLWFAFVTGALASVFSVAIVVRSVELPMVLLRSGRRMATWTAFALTLMAILAVAGVVSASFQGHDVPALGNVFYTAHFRAGLTYVITPQWLLLITPLVVAAAISVAGWRSTRRAWRVTLSLTDAP